MLGRTAERFVGSPPEQSFGLIAPRRDDELFVLLDQRVGQHFSRCSKYRQLTRTPESSKRVVGIGVKIRARSGHSETLLANRSVPGTMQASAHDASTLVTAPLQKRRHWVGPRRDRAVCLGPHLSIRRTRTLHRLPLLESVHALGRDLAARQSPRTRPFLDWPDKRSA